MINARRPSREVLLTAVRRFWAVALIAGLAAGIGAAALVRATATTTWSGEATYIVPVSAPPLVGADGVVPPTDPRLPNSTVDAVRFAAIYALLLVEDGAVLDVLSDATGLSPGQVAASTEALSVPDSPVVRVSFSAGSEEVVEAYFAGVDRIVAERPALSSTIRPGTLEPLRAADVSSSSGFGPLALVLGVVVALGVGLGGAVFLERGDPRLRSAADVRELADWPVLVFPDDDEDPRLEVLVQRVVDAAEHVQTVAVVGVAGTSPETVEDAADRLQRAHDRLVGPFGRSEDDASAPEPSPAVAWVAGGELTVDGAAESLAQRGDVVVLLAPVGARLPRLDGAVTTLGDLAVGSVVVALVPRRGRQRTGRPTLPDTDDGTDELQWRSADDRSTVGAEGPSDQGHDRVSPHR